MQSGQDPEREVHTAAAVCDGRTHAHGGPIGLAGDAHPAPSGLSDKIERLVVRPRPPGAVAADRGDDQTRERLTEPLGRQAEPRERAGREVLGQNVRALEQSVELPTPPVLGQIEHDAPLALVVKHEERAVAFRRRPCELSRRIAAGRLHLDHVRAEPGEELGRRGTRLVLGEIDDAHVGEGMLATVREDLFWWHAESVPQMSGGL